MENTLAIQEVDYQLLARQVATGDASAETRIFRDMQIIKRIGLMIRRRLRIDEDDREDLEIEIAAAFLIYLRSGRYNANKGCLMSCLWGITQNKTKDFLKRKKRAKTSQLSEHILVYQTEAHLERKELRETMQKRLKHLDQKYHLVLRLRYYESYSIEDIADFLELTVSQVYNRIHYGLRLLTRIL